MVDGTDPGGTAPATPPDPAVTETPAVPAVAEAADKAASVVSETDKGKEAPVAPVVPEVPESYDLKLPDDFADPTLSERTAATARELGLSNENAQKALDFVAGEVSTKVTAALTAIEADWEPSSDSNPEGGARWREQGDAWKSASLVDKALGNGDPAKLAEAAALADRVVATFGDDVTRQFLHGTGLGFHPAALSLLVKIGRAMSEGSLVIPKATGTPSPEDKARKMYPTMTQ